MAQSIGPKQSPQGLISDRPLSAMIKFALMMLWVLSIVSALMVVYSTYESRRSVQMLEELRREAIGLRVSSGKFQLEKSALGAYPRVAKIAQDKLKMSTPVSAKTVLVVRE